MGGGSVGGGSVGGGSVGGGIVGGGSGVSGTSVTTGDDVGILTDKAVFVGFGLLVDVAGGGLIDLDVAVERIITGVFEIVGDGVMDGVAVGIAVEVGVIVYVGISSENASKVRTATEFGLENAKSTTSPGCIAIGSCKVGSYNATADAPQNKLSPRMLAAKIQRSPA